VARLGFDGLSEFLAARLAAGQAVRKLSLRNYVLAADIGVHAFERGQRQRLIVNVDLYLDAERAAADEIAAVLDYDFLREEIRAYVAGRRFNLQETVAEGIADLCLARRQVAAVRVATEKPDVYDDCDGIGYEVIRLAERRT
jgi:7,8-dihydroneopterin aldolase/epimerase/oxygenase